MSHIGVKVLFFHCADRSIQYEIAYLSRMWSSIAFHFALLINIIVGVTYPYEPSNKLLGTFYVSVPINYIYMYGKSHLV